MAQILVGIGGWNFAPWRGTFYPTGLPQAKELDFASQQVTSIEINATFYGSQKPSSFRNWRAQTPEHFVFAVKGPRYATHRRDLTDAAQSIDRFFGSGVLELGEKLGPVLWQFPEYRAFDADAMRPFLDQLPKELGGIALRHVIETRHASFADPAWIVLLRDYEIAPAIVESDKHAMLTDVTAPFVYARLERNAQDVPEGYDSAALDRWAARFRSWGAGGVPADLDRLAPSPKRQPRPCFVYFISGDKVRAPDAARAMLRRLAA